MDVEIHKWCDELGLKGKEATEFIKLHKFDIDVYEYIQLCKEMEMENDDIIELFLIGAEIRRSRCRVYYDRLLEVSEREAAAEKFERKCKLLENEFISKVEETPNPIIEVISTKKSSTPESVSLENIVIEIEKTITSSQVLPMKGENCFSQPQSSAEREEPSSQDLPILSTSPKWESNEDEISSLSKAFAEQDEKEENSIESSNIAVVSESVYENEDTKVETSSYLSFSSSSSSSLSFSSSFSNSIEDNKTKSKKKRKRNHRKKKRKEDDENNYEGSNILNYKNDRRTASKRSIIQALGSNCPNRVKFAEDSSTCNIGSSPEFKESVQGASSNKQGKDGSEGGKEQKTVPSQRAKNQIMLFNELQKCVEYKMLEESGDSHSKPFKFGITAGGQCFEEISSQKKLSKAVAAKEALNKLFSLIIPSPMDLHYVPLTSHPNLHMHIAYLADKISKSVFEKFLSSTSVRPNLARRKIQRTRQYKYRRKGKIIIK